MAREKLQGLDAAFLYSETPETPMHVAGFTLFDLPEGYGGRFFGAYRDFIAARLGAAALFTRKLQSAALNLDHPVWVEDDTFDLDYHVRGVVVAEPGDMVQVEELVGRLHSEPLSRERPLWQFTVIEGLAGGRAALYSKVHHAALDGGAGMVLNKALYEDAPTPRDTGAAERVLARPAPAAAGTPRAPLAVVGDLYMNYLRQQMEAIQRAPAVMQALSNVFLPRLAEGASLRDLVPSESLARLPPAAAPRTMFNVQISGERAYAIRVLPLALAKRLAKATGTKLNDVVMAVCAAALRRYLMERGALPAEQLLASVPVSLRAPGNTEMNNQVTAMTCGLATHIADPLARLAEIAKSSVAAKSLTADLKDAMSLDYWFLGAPIILSGLSSLYGRSGAANWVNPPFNVVISNVPGPATPLYCGEARVAGLYPVSIPSHGVALNMTVQSYLDDLDFGLTADRKAVSDLDVLADYLVGAFDELVAAAGLAEPTAKPAPAAAPVKARAKPKVAAPRKPKAAARAPVAVAKPKAKAAKPTIKPPAAAAKRAVGSAPARSRRPIRRPARRRPKT